MSEDDRGVKPNVAHRVALGFGARLGEDVWAWGNRATGRVQHASALVTTRSPGCFDYGHRRLFSPPKALPPPPTPPPIPAGRTEVRKE